MGADPEFKPRSRSNTRYARQMVWRDQDPPAVDVLLDFTVPFSGGGTPAYLEIDKLPEGRLATLGEYFYFQEDWGKARDYYSRALAERRFASALSGLGMVELMNKDFAAAATGWARSSTASAC